MQKVLPKLASYKDFNDNMEKADAKSKEYNNSSIPERVCLLRELNFYWYKTRSELFCFPGEESKKSGSPHILCLEEENGMRFNIVAEERTVFEDLNFNEALCSFFHLVFVVDMKYPKKAEALCIWLQKKVAVMTEAGKN